MPRIVAATRALPLHAATQQQVKDLIEQVFEGRVDNLVGQLRIFDHARIKERQFIMPLDWYMTSHSPAECNQIYLHEGMKLLQQAVRQCLQKTSLQTGEIDHLICVSSTGHATPSLDARLIDEAGLSPATTRLPIWGLGCAAGAAALSRAFDYCVAYPEARVLVVALECCSLTFRRDDSTKKNLVGTALFGDGAAAALIVGDEINEAGPRIVATRSHLFKDTSRIMGWDFDDGGMQLVLSPKLPSLIRNRLPGLIKDFLQCQRLEMHDLLHYVTHPGGARVIDAYREALGLRQGELMLSEKSLREHGNISSVSVLMVLEEWLASQPEQQPGYGLLSAFGPGFSADLLLLEA
jgi:alkylresorcinol/alkylpyrone synthase